jgi:hypothetical protein
MLVDGERAPNPSAAARLSAAFSNTRALHTLEDTTHIPPKWEGILVVSGLLKRIARAVLGILAPVAYINHFHKPSVQDFPDRY